MHRTRLFCCVALLSGCALLTPVQDDTHKGMLSSIPQDLPVEKTHAATLLVLAPATASVYDTTQMAYTTQTYEVAYFSRNEWAQTPAHMMLPLMVETLRKTRYFSAVVPSPDFGHHTYALRTEIRSLKQDFTADPAMLELAVQFHLTRESTHQIIATREVSLREPMRERNPSAGVVAANEAAAKVLRELARFVSENTEAPQGSILRKVSSLNTK